MTQQSRQRVLSCAALATLAPLQAQLQSKKRFNAGSSLATLATGAALLAWVAPASASVDFLNAGAVVVNAPWPVTPTGGAPLIDTVDTIAATTIQDAPGNYTNPDFSSPYVAEHFIVLGQTIVPTSNFKLGQIAIVADGNSNANMSAHLYEIVSGTAGDTTSTGSYNLSTANTGNSATPDLLGGGSGLPFAFAGAGTKQFYTLQFTGADQINLQAGKQYAFEIHRTTNADSTLFWYRLGGAAIIPDEVGTPNHGNPYAPGNGYNAAAGTANTNLRTRLAGNNRDLLMSVYDTSALPAFPMKVDLNGGPSNHSRPNNDGYRPWGTTAVVLPTTGNGASPDPQGGYGTDTISKEFGTSGLVSGTFKATLKSVDVGQSGNNPVYLNDGAKLNSRDYSVSGREFTNSGAWTPSKDFLYRDVVIAEAGNTVEGNGTSHRMEITYEGLDPNTNYKLTFYAHDNSNQRSVQVFTDVTTQPLIFMPSAFSSEDTLFQSGDGSGATEYAPAGQYIIGPTDGGGQPVDPTYPVADDFRAVTMYATADGTGKLVFAQTTVTGLAGSTQVLPVLNGFELEKDQRSWGGGSGTNWNNGSNWTGGIPNAKGQVANFGTTANTSITVDSATTVGRLNFSGSSMTIGGGSTLTLDDTSINSTLSFQTTGRTEINLTSISSNQTITAPLQMLKDTQVSVSSSGTTLTTSNLLPATVNLRKAGAGTFVVNNARVNALSVLNGTMRVQPNSGATGVSKVTTVFLSGGAKLDITDNKLITTSGIGTHNGTNYTGVTGLVESGRNGGVWDGAGITTSMPDATGGSGYTSLGVATGSEVRGIGATDTDIWAGQTVTGSNTLVMYTYGGDANLSGNVDIDDYGQIDFNASTGGVLTGWYNGDFDYNGIQDIDDYGVIDFVVGIQGAPFYTSGGLSISAIPEPSAACGVALLAGSLLRRRRR